VFLWSKPERVEVDEVVGDASVGLVGLDQTEVGLGSDGEAFVSVQEDEGVCHEINGRRWNGDTGEGGGPVKPVVVGRSNGEVGFPLKGPDEFLDGVVVVQTNLLGDLVDLDGFESGELELVDQIFVGHLCEPTSFLGRFRD